MWSMSMVMQAMYLRAVPLSPQRVLTESVSDIKIPRFHEKMREKMSLPEQKRLHRRVSCSRTDQMRRKSARFGQKMLDRMRDG